MTPSEHITYAHVDRFCKWVAGVELTEEMVKRIRRAIIEGSEKQ